MIDGYVSNGEDWLEMFRVLELFEQLQTQLELELLENFLNKYTPISLSLY